MKKVIFLFSCESIISEVTESLIYKENGLLVVFEVNNDDELDSLKEDLDDEGNKDYFVMEL